MAAFTGDLPDGWDAEATVEVLKDIVQTCSVALQANRAKIKIWQQLCVHLAGKPNTKTIRSKAKQFTHMHQKKNRKRMLWTMAQVADLNLNIR
eukprot:2917772-Rhodomonas_salina.1